MEEKCSLCNGALHNDPGLSSPTLSTQPCLVWRCNLLHLSNSHVTLRIRHEMTAAVPHRGCPTTTGLSLCPRHMEGEWKEINSGSNLMPWTESHSVEFVPFGIFDKDFSCKEGERVKVEEKGGGNWIYPTSTPLHFPPPWRMCKPSTMFSLLPSNP